MNTKDELKIVWTLILTSAGMALLAMRKEAVLLGAAALICAYVFARKEKKHLPLEYGLSMFAVEFVLLALSGLLFAEPETLLIGAAGIGSMALMAEEKVPSEVMAGVLGLMVLDLFLHDADCSVYSAIAAVPWIGVCAAERLAKRDLQEKKKEVK